MTRLSNCAHRSYGLTRRSALQLALAGSCVLFSQISRAEPRDDAAQRKISEAMSGRFAAGQYAQAESLLLGTDKACADRCSANVRARIWLYVGSVRGSGYGDQTRAAAAFDQAIGLDPSMGPDPKYTNAATQQTYEDTRKNMGIGIAPAQTAQLDPASALTVPTLSSAATTTPSSTAAASPPTPVSVPIVNQAAGQNTYPTSPANVAQPAQQRIAEKALTPTAKPAGGGWLWGGEALMWAGLGVSSLGLLAAGGAGDSDRAAAGSLRLIAAGFATVSLGAATQVYGYQVRSNGYVSQGGIATNMRAPWILTALGGSLTTGAVVVLVATSRGNNVTPQLVAASLACGGATLTGIGWVSAMSRDKHRHEADSASTWLAPVASPNPESRALVGVAAGVRGTF